MDICQWPLDSPSPSLQAWFYIFRPWLPLLLCIADSKMLMDRIGEGDNNNSRDVRLQYPGPDISLVHSLSQFQAVLRYDFLTACT